MFHNLQFISQFSEKNTVLFKFIFHEVTKKFRYSVIFTLLHDL